MGNSGKPFCVKGGECIGNVPTTLLVAKYKDAIMRYCSVLWKEPIENDGFYAILHQDTGSIHFFFGKVLAKGIYKIKFFHYTVYDENFDGSLSVGKSSLAEYKSDNNIFDGINFTFIMSVAGYLVTVTSGFNVNVGDEVRCKWGYSGGAAGAYLYLYAIPYLELQE